ncbi:MAG: benzoate/H(+) symporter BenE family transporter [Rhodospirillales bacterium]
MRPSVVTSAVVATLVGFAGTLAIVISAAKAVGAGPAETSSWVTGLCLAMAGSSVVLSWRHRIPAITAWSTPGAALIAATAGTIAFDAAVGAFVLAALLVLATAAVRPLADLVARIPPSLASAMLAGILVQFAVAVFQMAGAEPAFVLPLVALFLVARVLLPSMAPIAVLAGGVALGAATGRIGDVGGALAVSDLMLVTPAFDPAVLIGLGVPLWLVTMASQNLPGFTVLRAAGYPVPARSILTVTGLASLLTAPFGAHTSNLAASSAAICTGPDTHPDPAKRWPAGVAYGLCYLLLAPFGASFAALFAALPGPLVATVAGTALMSPLAGALGGAMAEPKDRFAAVVTFAVTASGLGLLGIGAAFWGLVAGLATLGLERAAAARRG